MQTDAYASYDSVVLESGGRIIAVGCWAHARREFFDARLNQTREVHYVLGLITQLYDIEDEIRACERSGDFGPRFIELARSVYQQNDRRAAIKRRINERLGSEIVEEKSYGPADPAST